MPVWYREGKILSCSDAVAKAIEWHLQEKGKIKVEVKVEVGGAGNGDPLPNDTKEQRGPILNKYVPIFLRGACPECGGSLLFEEGCVKCLCGYSDCG
jgi:ribonucleoside-diphosphate reductase alpha chain